MKAKDYKISKEKFVFCSNEGRLHDQKLDTKPMSYLKDAFSRFKRNRASITAAIIIGILILFAIFVPIFSKYTVQYNDTYYRYISPKNKLFAELGIPFWDGTKGKEATAQDFYFYYSMGQETGKNAIVDQEYSIIHKIGLTGREVTYYKYQLDTYQAVGVVLMDLRTEQYQNIQNYQDEKGIQVIYPITIPEQRPTSRQDVNKVGNYWYATEEINGKTSIILDDDGNLIPIYKSYTGTDDYYSALRYEGEGYLYDYSTKNQTGYSVRVNYYEYYIYYHTYVLQDGITEPMFLFGTTNYGADILTSLASGARFSFALAIIVASINLFVGAIYGAIEGYYGGRLDLAMERIVDVLAAVPFMIVISLLKYHLENVPQAVILFIAFFITGWIGMAGRTRMQFYRFKNQEYVLAARTLGANDRRIMFKHIFPNAIGTLITSFVLVIPGMIFSETSLSYLGIINLNTGDMTSVGTLLASAQPYLVSYPHMIFFPAVFISLLMLSFNLFGNGLRDAFNPSLRGTED
ncbi:MAG: ABC transporter permease [Bacilli bacterium]